MLEAVDEQDQLGHWSRSTLTTIVCYGDESLLGVVHVDDLASFNGPAPALEVMHHSMLAFYQETAYTMIYIAKSYSISNYVGPGAIWSAK